MQPNQVAVGTGASNKHQNGAWCCAGSAIVCIPVVVDVPAYRHVTRQALQGAEGLTAVGCIQPELGPARWAGQRIWQYNSSTMNTVLHQQYND
jgi:hypothetical protein